MRMEVVELPLSPLTHGGCQEIFSATVMHRLKTEAEAEAEAEAIAIATAIFTGSWYDSK